MLPPVFFLFVIDELTSVSDFSEKVEDSIRMHIMKTSITIHIITIPTVVIVFHFDRPLCTSTSLPLVGGDIRPKGQILKPVLRVAGGVNTHIEQQVAVWFPPAESREQILEYRENQNIVIFAEPPILQVYVVAPEATVLFKFQAKPYVAHESSITRNNRTEIGEA